jgi:hypothetical protein
MSFSMQFVYDSLTTAMMKFMKITLPTITNEKPDNPSQNLMASLPSLALVKFIYKRLQNLRAKPSMLVVVGKNVSGDQVEKLAEGER